MRLDQNSTRRNQQPYDAAHLKSAGDPRGLQNKMNNQPVPDQRYYTKTNFFTLNNNGGQTQGEDQMSVADKYAHMNSQKFRKIDGSIEEIPQHPMMQHHHRMQSYDPQILGASPAIDPEFFNQKPSRSSRKPQHYVEQMMGTPPSDFDSSNNPADMAKRKIKKRRIIQAQPMMQ